MRPTENAIERCLFSLGDVLMTTAIVQSKSYLIAKRRKIPQQILELHVRGSGRVRSCCYGVTLSCAAVRMQIEGTLGGVHV